jgi:hypothetical protein
VSGSQLDAVPVCAAPDDAVTPMTRTANVATRVTTATLRLTNGTSDERVEGA